jgi:hydroxyethylthiazole kinase-like uncharacterized protein yjeF
MQNLLSSAQIRDTDAYTITSKPISSVDLMETASSAFAEAFEKEFENKDLAISFYCGTGNNGGDGLAVARLLKARGYLQLSVNIVRFSEQSTADFDINLKRLQLSGVPIRELRPPAAFPHEPAEVLVDALLGSGLNRPAGAYLKELIDHINSLHKRVISIDIPSGLPAEGIIDPEAAVIQSSLTISFQRPRINFFFPESVRAVSRFSVVPIGLDEAFMDAQPSHWKLIGDPDIQHILKERKAFSHKGSYGHALIVAGSKESMGAAMLCADACLHSGAGLTTACIPESGLSALNSRSPEVMALLRNESIQAGTFEKYSAIAIGPGLGTHEEASGLLESILSDAQGPMVLDADALSLLARRPGLLKHLAERSILTPHMKEFDRLFGEHHSWWERIETARSKAAEHKLIILLKNQYTFIVLPDGAVLINPTGNPAMAVGGMGDVLTGMITAFLAQGYAPTDAAMLGCYLHGKAGDELAGEGMYSIPPRYLIERLPRIIGRT